MGRRGEGGWEGVTGVRGLRWRWEALKRSWLLVRAVFFLLGEGEWYWLGVFLFLDAWYRSTSSEKSLVLGSRFWTAGVDGKSNSTRPPPHFFVLILIPLLFSGQARPQKFRSLLSLSLSLTTWVREISQTWRRVQLSSIVFFFNFQKPRSTWWYRGWHRAQSHLWLYSWDARSRSTKERTLLALMDTEMMNRWERERGRE